MKRSAARVVVENEIWFDQHSISRSHHLPHRIPLYTPKIQRIQTEQSQTLSYHGIDRIGGVSRSRLESKFRICHGRIERCLGGIGIRTRSDCCIEIVKLIQGISSHLSRSRYPE